MEQADFILVELAAHHGAVWRAAEDGDDDEGFVIGDGIAGAMSRIAAASIDGIRAKVSVAARQAGGRPALDIINRGGVEERHLLASIVCDLIAQTSPLSGC